MPLKYEGIVPYLFYDDAEAAMADRDFGVRMLNVPDEMGYLWGFIRRN